MRTTIKADDGPIEAALDLQLVVVGPGTMATIALPQTGELTIGRATEAHVRIEDALASRLHARLRREAAGWQLEDLGSSNGTKLGDRTLIRQSGAIFPGDIFTIGSTLLMLQQLPRDRRARKVWTHAFFVGRVEEECLRAGETNTTFAIARVRFTEALRPEVVARTLGACLGAADLLASYGGRDYEVLRPGLGPADLAQATTALKTALGEIDGAALVRFASYPSDGRTADALLAQLSGRVRSAADRDEGGGRDVVVADRQMADIFRIADLAAQASASVLITGETGVGKDVLARFVHDRSKRKDGPFVHIDLAALSDTLADSELFGYERGAFTGATKTKPGLLETAKGGTVFLNEIGELPPALQGKLLRAVQDRQVRRLGDTVDRAIDVRWIAATNKNLRAAIASGAFRDDLYFRLAVVTLVVPPLRDRASEIEPLIRSFVSRFCAANGRPGLQIDPETLALLEIYDWPGNIRELANVIERAVVLCEGSSIKPEHLPDDFRADLDGEEVGAGQGGGAPSKPAATSAGERERLLAALEQQRWRIAETAKALGVGRTTLWKRMKALGIATGRGVRESS